MIMENKTTLLLLLNFRLLFFNPINPFTIISFSEISQKARYPLWHKQYNEDRY